MALSLEQLQKIEKQGIQGRQKKKEEMAKPTNAAPVNKTVPKPIPVLNAASRRQQIMQGTDPATQSLIAKEAELNARRAAGMTNVQRYGKRFELPLADNAAENMARYANQSPQERYNEINNQAKVITDKGVNATPQDFEKLDELRNIGAKLEEQIEVDKNAPLGQYGKGNIDLTNRPKYRNSDGSISTVRSMSFNEDGKEILVPTIDYDAFGTPRLLSDEEAIDRYHRTGEYLGKFNTVEEANEYAEKLHREQEDMLDDKSLILSDKEYNALQEEAKRITDKGVNASMDELNRYQEIQDIVEKSEAEKQRQDILAGKHHAVDNATYQKLMSDGRFASDIDKLVNVEWNNADQDATVSPEWAEAYGAKNITGGLTKEQFYTQLSKRYDLTKEQLHDIALSRKAEIESGENQRYAENLANFGEEHPLLGSAGSLLGTAGSAVEGPFNTLIGGVTGDDRYMSRMFDTTKNAPREGAKRNMEHDLTKGLYDVGMGVADMGAGALLGNAPTVLAGNTMNRTMLDAVDKGIDPRRAAVYSGASGVVDYITNTIGLDKAKELASSAILQDAGLDAIGERIALAGIAGYGEGGENLVQDVAQSFIDRIINGENSELNMALNQRIANGMSEEDAIREVAKEYAQQELMSFATGVGMGATMNLGQAANNYVTSGLAGKALESYANRSSEDVWNAVRDWETQNNVDNVNNVVYNNPTGGGQNGTETGEGYDRARGEGLLGAVNTEGQRVEEPSGIESEGRGHLSADSIRRSEQLRNNPSAFTEEEIANLNSKGVETKNFYNANNDPDLFVEALETAKASNDNGAAVDSHSVEQMQDIVNNGGNMFLMDDGMSGYAVEGNGNLTAVFKNSNSEEAAIGSKIALASIKNGATKGDCFGRKLVNIYARGGYEPVGRMAYGYDFNKAMDAQVRQQLADGVISKEPDVYVLKRRDDFDYDRIVDEWNNPRTYSQAELDSLPEFTDYDEMLAYRDSMIQQPSEVASSMPRAEAPAQIPQVGKPQSAIEGERAHIDAETKRINDFMSSKRSGSIEAGGHYIEHYSKKEMTNVLKEYKQGGECPPDIAISILYNDGTIANYVEGDDLSNMKLTNINSVIYGNENTDAFSGNYVRAYNDYDGERGETFDEGIWRLTFKDAQEERAARESTQQIPQLGEVRSAVMEPEVTPENVNNNVRVDLNGETDADDTSRTMAEDTGLGNISRDENGSIILEEELPPSGAFTRSGEARFMTRDAIDSGVITPEEYNKSPILQDIAKIARHNNDQVYAAAEQEVREHGKEWFNDVIKGNKILGSDPDKADYDFNTGMIMLQGLADRIQLAKTPEEKARFTTLRNALLAKMRAFSTNAARTLQAHKMWVNTADGAMLANDTIRAKRVADYMSTHQEQSRENARIAQALKLQGYDGSMDVERVPKTHEEIRQEVINTIDREFSSVRDRFNDTAIDYLTALAEDKSVPIWQIRDELEHFLNHGEFYTIDESTNVTLEKSSKLARALDGAVNGKETTKVEKAEDGYYKTREKVINTLNEDYASVRDQFNDNDIDFIVTMLMEKLPTWQIEDEIRHKLEHGTWYTIDESIPEKAKRSKELASILKKVGEPEKAKGTVNEETGYPEKSHATYVEEVTNTLNSDEMASLGLNTPTDIEVLATYLEEGVSKKAIGDSIAYRLANGEWPTLTEGLEPQSAQSSRIRNAINQRANEANGVEESAPMSLDRQIELVKHAFENNKEKFPHELSDADYRYLATMLQNGASVQEIKSKLDYYAHYGKFEIDPSVQERVYQLGRYMDNLDPESEDYDRAQLEMFRLLANESDEKASAFEKFEAWRYLAMLGNPKTMFRNWIGNQLFAGVTGFSNTLAALGEAGVDKLSRATGHEGIERTRAVYNPFSKGNRDLTEALQKDFNRKRYVSGAGTKYKDMKKGIEDAKEVFDSDAMRFIQSVVDKGISDTSAVRRKYASSLLGYMKANGLTEADLNASYEYDELRRLSRNMVLTPKENAKMKELKATADKMEKARDFALEQAKYATFHEDNKYAKGLAKLAGSGKVAKVFVDGLVPFKSTPLNVLRSGIEYSPLGITRSGYLTIKHAIENTKSHKNNWGETYKTKKGKEITRTSVNDVIESWSRSLTGAGLAYLGYMLFGKGVITSSRDDEKYQDQLEGLQNFAIKLNINGKDYTYTIDWASPAAMPLLMGAEIKKIREDNGKSEKDFSASDFMDVCNSILNPVLETSMLQGISNSLESTSRALGSEGGVSDKAGTILTAWGANLASSYLSQGIPTLAGQFARTVDDTRRSTDTIIENPMGSELERTGRKIMNKIPGVSRLNEPYINARGEEEKNLLGYKKGETGKNVGRFLGNLAYQMVSPGYIDEVDTRKSDEIARDVYNSRQDENDPNSPLINDSDVFAKWASSPKVNGQKLTPKQAHDYREAGYSAREAVREALANEDWFNDLPATERNEILKKTNYLANEIGSKAAVPEYETTNKLYAEYAKTASTGDGKEKTGVQNVVDYLKNEAHGSNVKDALGTSADWASKIYDENDPDRLTKYNEYREMSENKGLDLTETDFLTYEQKGKDTLEKVLNYKVHAKDIGIDSDNKQFMKLVDSKVPDKDIKTAYDAIKSTKAGTDELGRDKALEFNETTYNIYKNDGGQKGLDRYVKFKKANVSYDLYKQAKKEIPHLSENEYIRTFHDMDGYTADGYKDPDGDISQKELLYYFNENGLDAYDVEEMWAAYGKVSGKDAWTMIPVLKKNKQNQYYWATENPNK